MLEEGEPVNVKKLASIWNLRTERVRAFLTAYTDLCPEFEKILNKKGWDAYSRLNAAEPQEPAPAKKPAKKKPAPKAEAEVAVVAEEQPPKEEPQPAPQPLKKREAKPPDPLNAAARQVYEECYQELFGVAYYWDAKAAGGMRNLLARVRYTLSRDHSDYTDQEVLDTLRMLLINVTDPWVMSHFSPQILTMKYNELINQVRNGDRDYKELQRKRKLAERMQRIMSEPYEGEYGADTPPPDLW